MLKDPSNRWDGLWPYEALEPVGITPESTMQEIRDASYDFMDRGSMSLEVRQAWDALRLPHSRFFVDFFLYHCDLSAELAQASEGPEGLNADGTESP